MRKHERLGGLEDTGHRDMICVGFSRFSGFSGFSRFGCSVLRVLVLGSRGWNLNPENRESDPENAGT
jgi:hypothetical protein